MNVVKNKKKIKVTLLTGGQDIHYALGLLSGLSQQNLEVEFIGNDHWQSFYVTKKDNIHYYNLRGDQSVNAPLKEKVARIIKYYFKLIDYSCRTKSNIFHILWLNKFTFFDRTILNIYYKIISKKLIFTAHDINYRKLVGQETFANSLSLKFMYRIVDQIVVHTEKMKKELVEHYDVRENKISIIPFGINEVIPKTDLTSNEAKKKVGVQSDEKILLFFGNIAPYKGLEYLVSALACLKEKSNQFKLIIAGRIKVDCQEYWAGIESLIEKYRLESFIIQRIEYIPEEEAEIYFKAADVLILPYKNIFQSGLVYTAYHFGLPVVAADVGSLKDDIVEGETGFVCRAEDPADMSEKILSYFESEIYRQLGEYRLKIIAYAQKNHSWARTGELTYKLYERVMAGA
jgi:D-inositol-3-phosphate glycosyltransferase